MSKVFKVSFILFCSALLIVAGYYKLNEDETENKMSNDNILKQNSQDENVLKFDDTPTNFAYTYINPDGNKYLTGNSTIQTAEPVDISLKGTPNWIVAQSFTNGSVWVVVMEDGSVQAFEVINQTFKEINITPEYLPPGMPPLLKIENDVPKLVVTNNPNQSVITHPVFVELNNYMAYLENNGSLVIQNDTEFIRPGIFGVPDARLMLDQNDQIILFTDPTTEYKHGILGDTIEATSITIINTSKVPFEIDKIEITPGRVIEGLYPILADINYDGIQDIIVTESDSKNGAQISVYNLTGEKLAQGPSIGTGFRWRHQLAVAPFAPNGELQLVEVLTPHIGGVVQFYKLEGRELRIVTKLKGYSSHVIGSRNLDMAVAADLDSDGHIELILPSQSLTELGVIQRTEQGAELDWGISLNGKINTNIAVTKNNNGNLTMGIGLQDGILRLWL
jgi:hypothetical protein